MNGTTCILSLSQVTKRFGGVQALSDVSLEVPRGQIVGIIGPNGAGKTTLFNVITGAYAVDDGAISLAGAEVTNEPPHRVARRGVSRTFQNIRLFGGMTVWEHLLVAQLHRTSFVQRLLPIRWSDPEVVDRAREVAAFFGLEAVTHRVARTLPYGIQRKVEMARAVAARPKLLLLDEPVAGMNHDEAEEIRGLMVRLRGDGLSILLIEHDMAFVMNLCDHLYVLDFGVIIAQGRPHEVRANPLVLDAYLGRE